MTAPVSIHPDLVGEPSSILHILVIQQPLRVFALPYVHIASTLEVHDPKRSVNRWSENHYVREAGVTDPNMNQVSTKVSYNTYRRSTWNVNMCVKAWSWKAGNYPKNR